MNLDFPLHNLGRQAVLVVVVAALVAGVVRVVVAVAECKVAVWASVALV